jgi:multidrug efflux pump subunit AcrB
VKKKYEAERAEQVKAGQKPPTISHELRGQIPPMKQMINGLGIGLLLAIAVIFLLLTANFQSLKLAFVAVAAAPAVIAGVLIALYLAGSTLNIQSFIGAIMAIGVAMANAILLITFAEQGRQAGMEAKAAAVDGGKHRLRAILMTSLAMLAGMAPLALALGEAGPQTAPLGQAVMGGLIAATFTTLLVLPALFALLQGWATRQSASLDPSDEASRYYVPNAENL